jgi:beta-phosphoglucomutase-like phosphatase (HAD superfamily)/predicted MFS family arabinose efflux permease
MRGFPLVIIAVLFCLNALDGFDALAISFAAPGITHEWGTSPQALGIIISLGLLATGLGSLLVAPLADKIGRRPLVFVSLASMTLGMLICAVAPGITTLSVGRLFTGAGVGALVPCISALTSENCSPRYKERGVIIMAIGFPTGGLVGGQAAALLLQHFDWRSVFFAGAAATALLTLAPLIWVPESTEYQAAGSRPSPLNILTQPALLTLTLIITLTYAFHGATLYYSLNWIPKIVVDLGLSASQAASTAAWCSGGGILGAVLAAWLATRLEIRLLTGLALTGAAIFLWLFAHTPGEPSALLVTSLLLGAFLYGAQVSLYALMTRSFPVYARATGIGFVTGVGRLGSVVSPVVSGYLLAMALPYSRVSSLMALGSLLGAAALTASEKTTGMRDSSKTFTAFLFDMDGTLINSIASANRVWRQWATSHGIDPERVLGEMHGVRAVDTVRRLNVPGLDPEREAEVVTQAELADVGGITAINGALAFLRGLPSNRWAIVTSAPRVLAVRRLAAAGIPTPSVLVTADDVTQGKPAPDCYLLAARLLGVAARDCLVWEDTLAGVGAAEAAGAAVMVISATHSHPIETPHPVTFDYEGLTTTLDDSGALVLSKR